MTRKWHVWFWRAALKPILKLTLTTSYDDYALNSQGLDITFVTTANTDNEALALLKAFQMPFRD